MSTTTPEQTHLNGEIVAQIDEDIKKKKRKNKYPRKSRPIGIEQYKQLREACHNPKLLRAMALLFYFGFRVNEPLQFKKVDIEQFILKGDAQALISKQSIKRTIFLSDETQQELMILLDDCKSEYFIKYKGDSLRVCLNRFIHSVLGKSYSSHGFRRDFVTEVYRQTQNLVIAQEAAGHADKSSTLEYIHVDESDLKKAYSLRTTRR